MDNLTTHKAGHGVLSAVERQRRVGRAGAQLLQARQLVHCAARMTTGDVRVASMDTLAMGCFVASGDDECTSGVREALAVVCSNTPTPLLSNPILDGGSSGA